MPGHIVGHPVSRIVAKAAGVPTGNVFAVLDVLQRIGRTDRAGYVAVETEYPVEEVNRIIAAMAMPDCGIIVDGALAAEWVLRRRTPEPPGASTKRWRRMQDARREAANGPPTAPTVANGAVGAVGEQNQGLKRESGVALRIRTYQDKNLDTSLSKGGQREMISIAEWTEDKKKWACKEVRLAWNSDRISNDRAAALYAAINKWDDEAKAKAVSEKASDKHYLPKDLHDELESLKAARTASRSERTRGQDRPPAPARLTVVTGGQAAPDEEEDNTEAVMRAARELRMPNLKRLPR